MGVAREGGRRDRGPEMGQVRGWREWEGGEVVQAGLYQLWTCQEAGNPLTRKCLNRIQSRDCIVGHG